MTENYEPLSDDELIETHSAVFLWPEPEQEVAWRFLATIAALKAELALKDKTIDALIAALNDAELAAEDAAKDKVVEAVRALGKAPFTPGTHGSFWDVYAGVLNALNDLDKVMAR